MLLTESMDKGILATVIVLIVLVLIAIGLLVFFLVKKNNPTASGDTKVLEQKLDGSDALYKEKFENLSKAVEGVEELINDFKKENSVNDKDFLAKLVASSKDLESLKSGDKSIDDKLNQQHKILDDKIVNIDKAIQALGDTANTSKEYTKKIDEQVSQLNNIFLASNKKRGNMGEYILNKLLEDIYGNSKDLWEEQYKMPDGNIIDAVVKTGEGKENFAIDSKFPLTNYNNYVDADNKEDEKRYLNDFKNDVKAKVKEVSKYIKKENNISNAIMFVPSEELFSVIYREFPDVVDDALKNKVWITSPTTLAALLSLIDKQNADARLDKNLDKVKDQLLSLKVELNRFSDRWESFKSANKKINDSIDLLDKTQNKIQNKYENIYTQSELNAVDKEENNE